MQRIYELEAQRYQLSEFERDTLSHYPDTVSTELMRAFRGGIMVFHNILYELWRRGLHLRIVPHGRKLTDLPECLDLKSRKTQDGKNYYDECVEAIYRPADKTIVIKEEKILYSSDVNQRYGVLIHEFAHAIWFLWLDSGERESIAHFYLKERKRYSGRMGYRLKNPSEFFAECFCYFVTPHHEAHIVRITDKKYFGLTVREIEREPVAPSNKVLRGVNIDCFEFLERKFKNIIEPELVLNQDSPYHGMQWDLWFDKKLYLPLIWESRKNF